MVKNSFFLVIVFSFIILPQAYCEINAAWDEITIKTNDFSKPLKVTIISLNDAISNISVMIGSITYQIPEEELKYTKKPQLYTTTIGYWDEDKLDFYIGLRCGAISSFSNSPLPQVVFFIFKDGKYYNKEVYNALPNPNISLEFYRLDNIEQKRQKKSRQVKPRERENFEKTKGSHLNF